MARHKMLRHLRWVWRWVYALALYPLLQMSVWMLSAVLAYNKHRQSREYKD